MSRCDHVQYDFNRIHTHIDNLTKEKDYWKMMATMDSSKNNSLRCPIDGFNRECIKCSHYYMCPHENYKKSNNLRNFTEQEIKTIKAVYFMMCGAKITEGIKLLQETFPTIVK